MTKLTEKEREGFEKILEKDLDAINQKFMNQIKDFWNNARNMVLELKGWDKLKQEKEKLLQKKEEIINRIHKIEEILNSAHLNPEQIIELGGKPNEFGRFDGANFYGIPVTSQFEYEIVEFIRSKINIKIPAKVLRDICESALRALTMAGTFEEARDAYNSFYSLNFRKYGVDIPPRLGDITKNKKMVEFAGESLNQSVITDKKIKLIGSKDETKI